jgi:hypothetical protein
MRALAITGALLLASPASGAGPALSLNGVPIDGVVNQRFENVTVVIDERGNVNIVARGYAVSRPEADPAPAPPPPAAQSPRPPAAGEARPFGTLTRRYYLVARQTEPGITEYDVSVFLNGRWVREVRSDGDGQPFEVTRFLQPGPNKVTLVATKRLAGAVRRSSSRDQTLKVLIGEGGEAGSLESPLVSMTRTAAETETYTEEHNLVAR